MVVTVHFLATLELLILKISLKKSQQSHKQTSWRFLSVGCQPRDGYITQHSHDDVNIVEMPCDADAIAGLGQMYWSGGVCFWIWTVLAWLDNCRMREHMWSVWLRVICLASANIFLMDAVTL